MRDSISYIKRVAFFMVQQEVGRDQLFLFKITNSAT